MLAPLSWIKEYVKTNSKPEILAEKLLLSGTKVEEIRKIGQEIVLNLEITPNRPDTLSMLGIAREIASVEKKEISLPETNLLFPQNQPEVKVNFEVKNKKLCPNYSLVRLKNLKIEKSPKWVSEFLTLANVRPLNNVVDITNFVMLELGQPMHAFDANKIKGKLSLRAAKSNEAVQTLDGQMRNLPEGSIIIEDEEKIVDLAGLMGGKNSEVDNKTTEIILLAPVYDPVTIRRTSLITNLRTEASNRFEKKLDPNLHRLALDRAIRLFAELASAKLASKVTSTPAVPSRKINFSMQLIPQVLGIDLKEEDFVELLSSAGFICHNQRLVDNEFEIQIPSYRADIEIEEDILEEVARLYGYNKFPKTLPTGQVPLKPENFSQEPIDEIRKLLLKTGFTETTGFTLIPKKDCLNFGYTEQNCLRVKNPASSDFEFLRPTLLINAVKALAANDNKTNLSFFEMAKTFTKETEKLTGLPKQKEQLSLITTREFIDFKGILDELFSLFAQNLTQSKATTKNIFCNSFEITKQNQKIGTFGQISPQILNFYDRDFSHPVWALEMDLNVFQLPQETTYKSLPKFPIVKEDVSFYLDRKFLIGEVIKTLSQIKFVAEIFLIDVFETPQDRSVTLSFNFLNPAKTMEPSEIEKVRLEIYRKLEKHFQARIRKD